MFDIAANEPDVNRARVMLDYGKWYLSKTNSKRFGDRIQTENNTNVTVNQRIDLSSMSSNLRNQLRAALTNQIKTIEHQVDD